MIHRYYSQPGIQYCDPIDYNNSQLWILIVSQVMSLYQSLKGSLNFARLIATGRAFHNRKVWTKKDWSKNLVVSGHLNFRLLDDLNI